MLSTTQNIAINNDPLISVVMCFYNCEIFISQAIECVLNQTFGDFELIIINDASTDSSDSIIQKYLSDVRIIYLNNEIRLGKVKNLQTGLAVSRSNIVAIMDGDDVCDSERFNKQYCFLENNPDISIVGSYVKYIDESGTVFDYRTKLTKPDEILKDAIACVPLVQPAVMFRKSIVQSVGGYRDKFIAEDWDLFYRLIYSGYKAANIPEYLLSYRIHRNNGVSGQAFKFSVDGYRVKKAAIRDFKLKLTLYQYLVIYAQLLIGCLTTDNGRRRVDGFAKKILYGTK